MVSGAGQAGSGRGLAGGEGAAEEGVGAHGGGRLRSRAGAGGVSLRRGRGSPVGGAAWRGRVCSRGPRPRAGVLCPLRGGEIGTKETAGGGGCFAGSGCPPYPVHVPHRGPQFRAGLGAPQDTSGFLKLTEEAGVLAAPRVVSRALGNRGEVSRRLAAIWQVGKLTTVRSIWCRVPSAATARRGHDWVSWFLVPLAPVRPTGVDSPAVVPAAAVAPWAKPLPLSRLA